MAPDALPRVGNVARGRPMQASYRSEPGNAEYRYVLPQMFMFRVQQYHGIQRAGCRLALDGRLGLCAR